ncbi:hypothetical protein ABKN59_011363 [Abortiporus biennis]
MNVERWTMDDSCLLGTLRLIPVSTNPMIRRLRMIPTLTCHAIASFNWSYQLNPYGRQAQGEKPEDSIYNASGIDVRLWTFVSLVSSRVDKAFTYKYNTNPRSHSPTIADHRKQKDRQSLRHCE